MAEILVINEPEELQLQHAAPKSFIITAKEAATFGIIMPSGPGVVDYSLVIALATVL